MARAPRWKDTPIVDGFSEVTLSRWGYFDDYVRQEMLDYRQFIWRGQCSAAWPLESTLDRLLRRKNRLKSRKARPEHLQRFVLSTRGRRGSNPATMQGDNDWWALGQHYGLATPLLDWTASPFVAAYFAFVPEDNGGAARRAIYALSRTAVERKSAAITRDWEESERANERAPIVEFIEPRSDENARLVSQGGLFTRGPDAVNLDTWMKENFAGVTDYLRLLKITVLNSEREVALRTLNRMNINHLSLFPDLYGASKFANLDLLIDKY